MNSCAVEKRRAVLTEYPYPVAYPYSLIFDEARTPSVRRCAMCHTEYQLLRMVCLPLVSQYLREPICQENPKSIGSLNRAIVAIRSPFFSDWISLVHTLNKHLGRVGVETLFPKLAAALDALRVREERPVGTRGDHVLPPLEAILALRNGTAHGGVPDEEEAHQHLSVCARPSPGTRSLRLPAGV